MIKRKEKLTALFMGIDGTSIAKCFPEAWKFRILRLGLVQIHLLEKQQDQVSMLHEFQK